MGLGHSQLFFKKEIVSMHTLDSIVDINIENSTQCQACLGGSLGLGVSQRLQGHRFESCPSRFWVAGLDLWPLWSIGALASDPILVRRGTHVK